MREDSSTFGWNRASEDWCAAVEANDPHRLDPGVLFMDRLFGWMGDVAGKRILDLGCGEGRYARALAGLGAEVTAIDCAAHSIERAKEKARESGLSITHYVRNSNALYGIEDSSFDMIVCCMVLMDCEDLNGTLKEAARVLKPTGRMFTSILHPCFAVTGARREGIGRMDHGIDRKVVVKDYFRPTEWEEPIAKNGVPVIWRHRTMQEYVKAFVASGFHIADLNEPVPTDEQAAICEHVAWLRKIPIFLFWELQNLKN